jgi:hypothetical protein
VSEPGETAPALEGHLARAGPTFLRVVIPTGARRDLGRPKLTPREV